MGTSHQADVVVTVNSPGEVATWLTPIMHALESYRSQKSGLTFRCIVAITPCVYASGTEERVIRNIPGIDEVLNPGESLRLALFGRCPDRWKPRDQGVLLHLGGEFALSARMAKHLRYSAFAYSEGFINTAKRFKTVFAPYETYGKRLIDRGVQESKLSIVGNLMVDAALDGPVPQASDATGQAKSVAIFPGSRPHEVLYATDFLLQTAFLIEKKQPDTSFTWVVSPFVKDDFVEQALERAQMRPHQLSIWRGASKEAMAQADLALTIPGSVTAELAARGVAHVVVLPLDRPEEIPLDGLLGYVDRIPLVGRRLKRRAVMRAAGKIRFTALPNRIADDMIVPELKSEHLAPETVADAALKLLNDDERRKLISSRLIAVMGERGAAGRIVSQLLKGVLAGNVGWKEE